MGISANDCTPQNTSELDNSLIDYQRATHERSTQILSTLLKGHVHLHCIYTAGRTKDFNYQRQFLNMIKDIDFASNRTLALTPHIYHTQVIGEDRQKLVSTIVSRLGTTYR